MMGKMFSNQVKAVDSIESLHEVEFKVFSQWGDDGIIQWLIHNIDFENKTFIEFGVSNYDEANTRFLLMNDNWSGFIMDGSSTNIEYIKKSDYYWKYDLTAKEAFINRENVNTLIKSSGFEKEIGILHIDLDGNDYWIWEEIDAVSPTLLILEYNSVFGSERAITVPYDKNFVRTEAHYSNLYFGASLLALCELSEKKGYRFIGCNSAGNNAFFIRKDRMNDKIKELSPKNGYVMSKGRESRDKDGKLTFVTGDARAEIIRGLPVIDTRTNKPEEF
tara:strand:+ start:3962 stop:4789 length:828 start_codon:yes stop_codon:yes gene_type:complete